MGDKIYMKIKVDQALSSDDKEINKMIQDSEKETNEYIKKLERSQSISVSGLGIFAK